MPITMPIWMFVLFLAVAMMAGLAAAIGWAAFTDLRKTWQDIKNIDAEKDAVTGSMYAEKNGIGSFSLIINDGDTQIIVSDNSDLNKAKNVITWGEEGCRIYENGLDGPCKLISRQENEQWDAT